MAVLILTLLLLRWLSQLQNVLRRHERLLVRNIAACGRHGCRDGGSGRLAVQRRDRGERGPSASTAAARSRTSTAIGPFAECVKHACGAVSAAAAAAVAGQTIVLWLAAHRLAAHGLLLLRKLLLLGRGAHHHRRFLARTHVQGE